MLWDPTHLPTDIGALRDRGALFVVNHSGGKDSQAMLLYLRQHIPADQLLVVHAHLPEVEWEGTWEHVQATSEGLEVRKVVAGKTFFEMVLHRRMWPSASTRQCTSDLKRGPIEKVVRHYLKENPRFGELVVNCMGMRAEESPRRAKRPVFQRSDRNCTKTRTWYEWLPIHQMLEIEVFTSIAAAGQSPHWVYGEGMTRMSCSFCILASRSDLCTAARLRPQLYRRFVEIERELGHTFVMPRKGHSPQTLEDITGIAA